MYGHEALSYVDWTHLRTVCGQECKGVTPGWRLLLGRASMGGGAGGTSSRSHFVSSLFFLKKWDLWQLRQSTSFCSSGWWVEYTHCLSHYFIYIGILPKLKRENEIIKQRKSEREEKMDHVWHPWEANLLSSPIFKLLSSFFPVSTAHKMLLTCFTWLQAPSCFTPCLLVCLWRSIVDSTRVNNIVRQPSKW